ncbi:hypothetical protein [Solibacillus sp. FSL K6-1523]|uniref:hypothetical protein n=1 Tax=Solibacillus sp. FSL K6-1523 TaxID=2921471 RepID=UPI0030FCA833
MSIAVKGIFVSVISAVLVSIFAVGGSTIATFIFYSLKGEPFGEIISTSRVIWFLILFVLSFIFLLFGLDKKYRT